MGDRKTFVFNTDWREVLRDYPAEVRLEVYEAVIDYVISGTYSELKPLSKMAFSFIKRELDYNTEKYNEVVAKRREAGLMGAAAKQANQANAKSAKQNKQMVANAKSAKQTEANQADIVYEYDNVNVLDKSNNAHTRVREGLKFVSEEYHEVFTRWVNYKTERKEKYKTKESLKECYERLKTLSGNNPTTAMAIVKQSIANNWAGLFELKQSRNGNSSQQIESILAQAKASTSHRVPILSYDATIIADRIFYHFCQRVLTKAGEVKDQERAYKAAQAVANWLTSSDKNKNLNLCGSVGVGKSTILGSLMDFLNETEYQYHKVLVTANKVAEIALYSESSWEILTKKPILLIDDVGTEPYEVKEYGNVYLPFTELLEHRYNRNLTTVITTNLTIADINSKYGARVADRVNEFHTLTFKRDSYRNG